MLATRIQIVKHDKLSATMVHLLVNSEDLVFHPNFWKVFWTILVDLVALAHEIKLFRLSFLDDRHDYRPFFTYWINTVRQ
jgi:hypothetical protein